MGRTPDYEAQEWDMYIRDEREILTAPISERKENSEQFRVVMAESPEIVAERIQWLMDGSFGWAQHQKAIQVLRSKRMNRTAALCHMIALWEWHTPPDMARKAWKTLTPDQQKDLAGLIQAEIADAENAQG